MGAAATKVTVLRLVVIGILAGVLSGLFGVGGGVIVVPALMMLVGIDQRRASMTSSVAIAPASLVGAVTYAMHGNLHVIATALLLAGSIVGSQFGVRLLRVMPGKFLPWLFIGFIVLVIGSLCFVAPPLRHGEIHLTVPGGAALVGMGLIAGILSGLVGVGGGVVVVPGFEILLGASDLLAKGTSLAMMVPTSISSTVASLRGAGVDLRAGLIIGVTAAVLAPAGVVAAGWLEPRAATVAFVVFLLTVAFSVLWQSRRRKA